MSINGALAKLTAGFDPVAVAVANDGVAGQSIVTGAGSAAMTGAVLSMTCMVWLAVDALPHPSVAVHVRVTLY